jgi:hypothetical protein
MPTFIASYDLKKTDPDPHGEFLNQSRNHGWNYWILSGQHGWYRLPNTTLEGTFNNLEEAINAFIATRSAIAVAIGIPVVLEKWIIVEYGNNRFDSDVKQSN